MLSDECKGEEVLTCLIRSASENLTAAGGLCSSPEAAITGPLQKEGRPVPNILQHSLLDVSAFRAALANAPT